MKDNCYRDKEEISSKKKETEKIVFERPDLIQLTYSAPSTKNKNIFQFR